MTNIEWTIEKRNIKDLVDYPRNARFISKEQQQHLTESIVKFGLIDKVIINRDNVIIGGHQRKRTLQKLKLRVVDCMVPSRLLTEEEVAELNIRLNRNTGAWDFEVLANQYELTELLSWGFTTEELFDNIATEEEKDDKPKKTKQCPHCGAEI